MASRRRKHTETTTEGHKKPWCVWFTSKVQPLNHLYTQGHKNSLEKLHGICKWRHKAPAESPYRMEASCNQVPWGAEARTWLSTRLLPALYPKSRPPEIFHRRFRNNSATSNVWAFFHSFWKSDFQAWLCLLKESGTKENQRERCLDNWKPPQCLNVRAGRQCLKLQKIKKDEKLLQRIRDFDLFAMRRTFSQQLSQAAVSEKPNSLAECKWRKQERAEQPWRVT